MTQRKVTALCLTAVLAVQACATAPMGPTVYAAKGPNKTYDEYVADTNTCRQFASSQVAGQAEAANNQAVGSAIIGTALGAALGAAVGGGRGAAIGAASGAVVGSSVGANQSGWANMSIQQRYDSIYLQCMSAHGHQVPTYVMPPPVYYYRAPGYYVAPPPPPPGS